MMDYHDIDRYSASELKVLLDTNPFEFRYRRQFKEEPTAAMILGNDIHKYILEPEKFAKECILHSADKLVNYFESEVLETLESKYVEEYAKDKSVLFNARKKQWQELKKSLDSKGIALKSESDSLIIERLHESFCANDFAKALLDSAVYVEKEIFYEIDGLEFKSKLDIVSKINGKYYISDIKTTKDANPSSFIRDMKFIHYDLQAAVYVKAFESLGIGKAHKFVFLALQKSNPWYCVPFHSDATTGNLVHNGNAKLEKCIQTIKECESTGVWPSYNQQGKEHFNLDLIEL